MVASRIAKETRPATTNSSILAMRDATIVDQLVARLGQFEKGGKLERVQNPPIKYPISPWKSLATGDLATGALSTPHGRPVSNHVSIGFSWNIIPIYPYRCLYGQ